MEWCRLHHGMSTDPKWMSVAKRAETQCNAAGVSPVSCVHVLAIWCALLDYASQQSPRGSVAGFDAESMADFLGIHEAQVAAILSALRDKGLISVSDDRLTNWEKRQPEHDDYSTPRVRAFRERQREQRNAAKRSETEGNARGEEKRGDEEPPAPPARDDAEAMRTLFPAVADALLPQDGRDPLLEVMRRVSDPRAYLAEMTAALTGMHGTTLSASQLRTAVIDWLANGETPNLRRFRGYLRGAVPLAEPPPGMGNGNGARRPNGTRRPSNAQQTYETTLAALEGRTP